MSAFLLLVLLFTTPSLFGAFYQPEHTISNIKKGVRFLPWELSRIIFNKALYSHLTTLSTEQDYKKVYQALRYIMMGYCPALCRKEQIMLLTEVQYRFFQRTFDDADFKRKFLHSILREEKKALEQSVKIFYPDMKIEDYFSIVVGFNNDIKACLRPRICLSSGAWTSRLDHINFCVPYAHFVPKIYKLIHTICISPGGIRDFQYFTQFFSTCAAGIVNINLSRNKITSLPDNIFNTFPNLYKLYLVSNQIRTISKHAFKGCNALQEIDLSNNQIEQLHLAFPHSLLYFNISNNRLTNIISAENNNLRTLRTCDNPYLVLQSSFFETCNQLKELSTDRDSISSESKMYLKRKFSNIVINS